MTGPMRRMRQQFDTTTRSARKMRRGLRSIDIVLSAIAVGAIVAVTKRFIQMGAEMEALRFRMGVFERSAEGAQRVFKNLTEQFKNVPFDLKTIGDSFVRLRAAGLEPLDGSLKAIIDGVAAFGGGSQELQRATIAIQQMAGKGVISMEELRQQLGEAIPFAMRVMADEMGISVAKLISQIERGNLAAADGIGALVSGLQKNFDGVADGMVNTMGGAFQALVKEVQGAADRIFNEFGVADIITLFLREMAQEVRNFVDGLDPEKVREFVFGLTDIVKTGASVIKWIFEMGSSFAQLVGKITSLLGADATGLLAAGAIGFLLFGPPGALLAMAVVALAGITRELKKTSSSMKSFFEGTEDVSILGEGVQRGTESATEVIIDISKDSVRRIKGATDEQNKQLEQIRKDREAVFSKLGAIGEPGGLSRAGQQQLTKLEKSIESITAKLRGAGDLPFLQQFERMVQISRDAASQFDADSKALEKFTELLRKAQATGDERAIATAKRDLARAQKDFADARAVLGQQRGLAATFLAAKLDEAAADVRDKVGQITNELSKRTAALTGDIFGDQEARARIKADFDEIDKKLKEELSTAEAINKEDGKRGALIDGINTQLARSAQLREQELAQVTQITIARERLFNIEQRNTANQISRDIAGDLRSLDSLVNPIKAAFTPEVVDQARQLREEITQTTEGLEARIAALQLEGIESGGLNEQQRTQIALLQERIGVLGRVKDATTETALLAKEMWSRVASTLQGALADGIESVITGHKSAKEIINGVFQSLTRAAAEYLAQLILIKTVSGGLGGFGGGFGGFGGFFAKGGTFAGNVKPFANGDIIRGPTLFGVAGEAGTEAIMPLTRTPDGKLGVQSTGPAGGGMFNLAIQAIDTQTGAQFLLRNLETIAQGMSGRSALNEGVR
jgi:tape measure domain-containing protein